MKVKTLIICLLCMNISLMAKNKMPSKKEIVKSMTMVCDWQIANLTNTEYVDKNEVKHKFRDSNWIRGTFLTGLMAQYYTTQNKIYLDSAIALCKRNNWKLGPKFQFADDLCVGQTYIELFKIKYDSVMILDVQGRLNKILSDPKRGPIVDWNRDLNWNWCDALFMAPPVFSHMYTITKNIAYLDTMNVLWNDTYNLLYDKTEMLFYRDIRFVPSTEDNYIKTKSGNKVFWSRGNGWVLGGLTRILQDMPMDYPPRKLYVTVFQQMCEKIATLQGKDGLWRSSLLDVEEYPAPETSGSGFYCYAMAWGINNKILPAEKYLPVVLKAWKGLNWAINKKTGMLGWVQAVGADPRSVTASETMEYGAGAFLLAGSEVYKMNR